MINTTKTHPTSPGLNASRGALPNYIPLCTVEDAVVPITRVVLLDQTRFAVTWHVRTGQTEH